MDRISALRKRMIASLPYSTRAMIAISDLVTAAHSDFFKKAINKALRQEFERAGIDEEVVEGTDFFSIVDRAVTSRVNRHHEDYDDLFQEVAMEFLDRSKKRGLKKDWVSYAKKLQGQGKLTSLEGVLFRSAKNYVKDLHRKLRRRQLVEERIQDPQDNDGYGGVDIDRGEGDRPLQLDTYSAKQLERELKKRFKWDKSGEILDILIKNGIVGFLGSGRARGVKEVADEMGVKIQTVSGYYRRKFKADVVQALRSMRDPVLEEQAQRFLAASQHDPMIRICQALNDIGAGLD